jgi:uncharacterized repeat protein (TIGR03803 family)
MKILNHCRHTLRMCVSAAMLAGCGGSQSAFAPSAMHSVGKPVFARGSTTSYKVLFNFVRPRGTYPLAGLTALNGTLYGTTERGSAYRLGTVFGLTTSGQERVLHSFNGTYGRYPSHRLTELNGILYGTDQFGGTHGVGMIFSITPAGKFRVVYSFKATPDGANPLSDLTVLNGKLYGTTEYGGTASSCFGASGGCGTVFSVNTAGIEHVVHSFTDNPDGAIPEAGMTVLNGTLYGTTVGGGTAAGKEAVLHSFGKVGDGIDPFGDLTSLNGTLYGTTSEGGSGSAPGTVFSVTRTGKERVLHSFNSPPDGAYPEAGLTVLNGMLYGTTAEGGAGAGTIFSVTTNGTERVLYSFKGAPDGAAPLASLTVLNGILYGTTRSGGTHKVGTAFALTP